MDRHIIHIVLGKANPDRMNGVNKVVNSLAEHQSGHGYKVSLWGITKTLTHNYPSRSYQTQLFRDKGKFRVSQELKSAINDLKEDVVFHFHGGFIPQFYVISKLLKRRNLQYILTPHGAYNKIALERSRLKKAIYIKIFESYLVKNAKTIHLIGASELDGTEALFGEVPCALIPNGQEDLSSRDCGSKIGNQNPIFGFVGRIDTRTKGLDILLKGFANYLRNTSADPQLWIIGDGADRQELEQLARNLNILANMKFFGAKYGTQKDDLIREMDFLCLTSRNEGLPGVVLEASALGTPAIVSKETNMAQYISQAESGFVLKVNSPSFIAKTMIKAESILGNHLYKLKSTAAVNMVSRVFSWSRIARQHIDLYHE
ncbi:MAG: glycosyltransferase family 4 protein [Flavobacteriales bacterium]|nr:glycosyltransferase family 4 protein [Flavobacteriales bacterium]